MSCAYGEAIGKMLRVPGESWTSNVGRRFLGLAGAKP